MSDWETLHILEEHLDEIIFNLTHEQQIQFLIAGRLDQIRRILDGMGHAIADVKSAIDRMPE